MIGEAIINIVSLVIDMLPIIDVPSGFDKAFEWLGNVIGFINIFLPIQSLAVIIGLIILVRNFNIVLSVVMWVLRKIGLG